MWLLINYRNINIENDFICQNITVNVTPSARLVKKSNREPSALVKIYSIGTFDDEVKNKEYSAAILDFFNEELNVDDERCSIMTPFMLWTWDRIYTL